MDNPAAFQRLVECYGSPQWRLNNLYWITDKEGHRVKFNLNWAQELLMGQMHHMNLVLKARQLGFTTFIQLFLLDQCVFNSNVRAGTIAHTLDDAKVIFRDKVKFPYDNLPEVIRNQIVAQKDTANELLFSNNSSIRVGTSLRSGTLQLLHISEYGKICAKYPEKAREVRTGALNTVQSGQIVFIESTAEGQEGHFYDLCEGAQSKQRLATQLTPLDFKFHFFPWWRHPEYQIAADGVVIPPSLEEYFETLRLEHGVSLAPEQKAWYAKKLETQDEDMKREYPATPAEAFEASVEGAYYGKQIAKAELDKRIGLFPWVRGFPVNVAWDIGVGDSTALWFWQEINGRPRLIDYYENSGEGLPHYIAVLESKPYDYGTDYVPHDARVKEWGHNKTRLESMIEAKRKPEVVPDHTVDDGIHAARQVLGIIEMDQTACADGLRALKAYRKEWDEERSAWRDKPLHNWASHGADSFRYFAVARRAMLAAEPKGPTVQELLTHKPTLNELVASTFKGRSGQEKRI